MIADYNNMPRVYSECRKKYFKDYQVLPTPHFGITDKKNYLGRFVGYKNRKKNAKHPITHPIISISADYDYDEEMFENLMVHEMIHYFIAFNHIKDDDDHGTAFMRMAQRLNDDYGLNITKKIDVCPKRHTSKNKTHKLLIKIKSFLSKLY